MSTTERSTVTSVGQRGGVTAHSVSVNQGTPAPLPQPPKPWWKSAWAITVGVVTFLAALVAVLEFLGLKPLEKHMTRDNDRPNVTSINQQGGITAGTVNIGSQARHMNTQLGAQILEHIPTDAKISITAVMGDGEAFNFAHEVRAWMVQNGYRNITQGVNQAVYSQPVMGQSFNKTADGFDLVIGTRQQ